MNEDTILIEDDALGFAEAVARVLQDDDLAGGMGRRAREFVRENFSAEKVGARYLDVIRPAGMERDDG